MIESSCSPQSSFVLSCASSDTHNLVIWKKCSIFRGCNHGNSIQFQVRKKANILRTRRIDPLMQLAPPCRLLFLKVCIDYEPGKAKLASADAMKRANGYDFSLALIVDAARLSCKRAIPSCRACRYEWINQDAS